MSITVITHDPHALKRHINKVIRNGGITTWEIDQEGDYTHSPEQWKNQAWFKTYCTTDEIIFGIWPPADKNISTEVYAVYHGRFSEMLLAHFDNDFSNIIISSLPTKYDRIQPVS